MVVQETVLIYAENTLSDASQKNKVSPSCIWCSRLVETTQRSGPCSSWKSFRGHV